MTEIRYVMPGLVGEEVDIDEFVGQPMRCRGEVVGTVASVERTAPSRVVVAVALADEIVALLDYKGPYSLADVAQAVEERQKRRWAS